MNKEDLVVGGCSLFKEDGDFIKSLSVFPDMRVREFFYPDYCGLYFDGE